ncbi:hypothetical protein [Novosphingobium lindaniclasticum]|uniref:Uncharacterized protein n=1 Tax=Novosphingobium lindaniclasticum LE124 TaxID=1096930 RepID=T0I6B9_9SPHN|nr:hypothetical protein [Novosphingobium lindaniclasticum]EQB07205.1 hypothetical protein L284_23445 [Novosphingobium lindaniclasticum LE124]
MGRETSVEQSQAEELARTLDMWAALGRPGKDPKTADQALLQAAALLRRQAHEISSLRKALQQARMAEHFCD